MVIARDVDLEQLLILLLLQSRPAQPSNTMSSFAISRREHETHPVSRSSARSSSKPPSTSSRSTFFLQARLPLRLLWDRCAGAPTEEDVKAMRALAEAVIEVCEGTSNFKFLYDLELPIEKKIEIISKEIYGADGIELSEQAQKQVDTYTRQGFGNLPSKPDLLLVSRDVH